MFVFDTDELDKQRIVHRRSNSDEATTTAQTKNETPTTATTIATTDRMSSSCQGSDSEEATSNILELASNEKKGASNGLLDATIVFKASNGETETVKLPSHVSSAKATLIRSSCTNRILSLCATL